MIKGDRSNDSNRINPLFVVRVSSKDLGGTIKNGWDRLVELFGELAPWDAVRV